MPPKRVAIDPEAIDAECAKGYRYQPDETVPEDILKYRRYVGRTYEADKNQKYDIRGYPQPNGEPESDCLDLQHAQLLLNFSNKLYLAPIPKEKLFNVLDFGTGTGIWAIDFAIEHPGTNVFGVDREPFRLRYTQENLRFQVLDLEKPRWSDRRYDLIHNRVMFGGLEKAPEFIHQFFECLMPGGYLEMVSFTHPILLNDGKWPDDYKLKQWSQIVKGAIEDLHPNPARMYENQMTGVGFKDVAVKKFRWPSSPWPREEPFKSLGYWQRENLLHNFEAHRELLAKEVLWTKDSGTLDNFLKKVQREILDPDFIKIHAYFEIIVVYGRKPVRELQRQRVMTPKKKPQSMEDSDYDPSPGRPKTPKRTKSSGKTPKKGLRGGVVQGNPDEDEIMRDLEEAGLMDT